MARPKKQGVDYFPLDVYLDDKFKFLEIKFGSEGFTIGIKLLQRVYAHGYWCSWTEDEQMLFSNEANIDLDTVQKVVSECLKRKLFNEELFNKYKILTSRGIQKRYKKIVRRRKEVEVIKEYLLIDGKFGVNDDIYTSSGSNYDDESTQRKVKKSKGKEKRVNNDTYKDTEDNDSIKEELKLREDKEQEDIFIESLKGDWIPEHTHTTFHAFSKDYNQIYHWFGIVLRAKNEVEKKYQIFIPLENEQVDFELNKIVKSTLRGIYKNSKKVQKPDNYFFTAVYNGLEKLYSEIQNQELVRI